MTKVLSDALSGGLAEDRRLVLATVVGAALATTAFVALRNSRLKGFPPSI